MIYSHAKKHLVGAIQILEGRLLRKRLIDALAKDFAVLREGDLLSDYRILVATFLNILLLNCPAIGQVKNTTDSRSNFYYAYTGQFYVYDHSGTYTVSHKHPSNLYHPYEGHELNWNDNFSGPSGSFTVIGSASGSIVSFHIIGHSVCDSTSKSLFHQIGYIMILEILPPVNTKSMDAEISGSGNAVTTYQLGRNDGSAYAASDVYGDMNTVVVELNTSSTNQGSSVSQSRPINIDQSLHLDRGKYFTWSAKHDAYPLEIGTAAYVRNFTGYMPGCKILLKLNIAANGLMAKASADLDLSITLRLSAIGAVLPTYNGLNKPGDCSVGNLTPVTDPLALRFEHGNTIDISGLTPQMQSALSLFKERVNEAGGHFVLNSAYRPPAYQAHLLEVWTKWQQLKDNHNPACQTLRSQVQAEMRKHQLRAAPASISGPHTKGLAIDVSIAPSITGLPLDKFLDIAKNCGLYRRILKGDPIHFEHL